MDAQLQSILQDFVVTLVAGVLSVLSGFIIVLVKKGTEWVAAKVETVKNNQIKEDTLDAIRQLESIVLTTVTALQQSLGDDIKNSIARGDGQYTKDDLFALKDEAVSLVENQLPESTVQLLSKVYADLDQTIDNLVETSVRSLKSLPSTKSTESAPSLPCETTEESKKSATKTLRRQEDKESTRLILKE